jgi:hypothetical protein
VSEVWPATCGTPQDRVENDGIASALGATSSAVTEPSKPALGETFGAAGMLALLLAAGRAGPTDADSAQRAPGRTRQSARVAMVHSLCYSGNSVATIISTDD